jgi:UDP-N-acetyl-D-mannosaminuronic acid dehydrogenase
MKNQKKIGVIGLGRIGLPLVAALAMVGFSVIGLDINQKRIKKLKKTSKADFYEPKLNENLKRFKNRIEFVQNYKYLMKNCHSIIIVVGTPFLKSHQPDFRDLENVVNAVGEYLQSGQVIILKSTVLPGTTRKVSRKLEEISGLRAGIDFHIAFCPERVAEGKVIDELKTLPKIVGGINNESLNKASAIIKRIGGNITKVSSLEVAEVCKLLDNTYRAVNIAFSNEIGLICEKMGIDGYEVVRTANKSYDRTNLFLPSLGAGGPCLSKDPLILNYFAKKNNINMEITKASVAKNQESTMRVVKAVSKFLKSKKIKKPKISLVGLAFKGFPETDDIRNSPAIDIYQTLAGNFKNVIFRYYDPLVENFFNNRVSSTWRNCLGSSNVVIFLTNHPALMNISLKSILSQTNNQPLLIVDCWHNLIDLDEILPEQVKIFRIGDKKYNKI